MNYFNSSLSTSFFDDKNNKKHKVVYKKNIFKTFLYRF